VNQLIILLGNDGGELPGLTDVAGSGPMFPDVARCRTQRLPRRVPRACLAYRHTGPPSPELLSRVLEGLRRL
jgi:hypothetical protein